MTRPRQPVCGEGSDSTFACTAAPLPRSVAVNEPRLNDGKTATPTMRMVRLARPYEGGLTIWSTLTRTVCPTRRCTARRVWAPSTISSGADGARPASSVR